MTPERIAEVLAQHGYRAGFLANSGGFMNPAEREGRWNCACGDGGPLGRGEGILPAHRAHLSAVLAALVAEEVESARTSAAESTKAFREVSNATAAEAHELGWREAIDVLGYVLANGPDWGPSQVVSDAMVYVAGHPTDPYNRAALAARPDVRGEGEG